MLNTSKEAEQEGMMKESKGMMKDDEDQQGLANLPTPNPRYLSEHGLAAALKQSCLADTPTRNTKCKDVT